MCQNKAKSAIFKLLYLARPLVNFVFLPISNSYEARLWEITPLLSVAIRKGIAPAPATCVISEMGHFVKPYLKENFQLCNCNSWIQKLWFGHERNKTLFLDSKILKFYSESRCFVNFEKSNVAINVLFSNILFWL